MDLRKLQIFVAVAQRKSFSQAATNLHMAQRSTKITMALAKRKGRTISKTNQAFLDWVAFKL